LKISIIIVCAQWKLLLYFAFIILNAHNLASMSTSDGSRSKFFDPGRVRLIFCGSGWVSHLWFGFEFGKFPIKMSNFSIFFPLGQKNLFGLESTWVKGGSASYLLRVKSKLGSGQSPFQMSTSFQDRLPPALSFPQLRYTYPRDGPWPDLARAYFWPTENKRPIRLWPKYILTWIDEIFLTQRQILKNLGFLGENFQTQTKDGCPNLTQPEKLKFDSTLVKKI